MRGGRSSRLTAALQPGNSLGLVWRARLDEHLGAFAVEPLTAEGGAADGQRAGARRSSTISARSARLLPERDPHEAVYEALTLIADRLDDSALAPALVARFEAQILAECGFRLDLSRCAATGTREDLAYVSPRSGRAVSLRPARRGATASCRCPPSCATAAISDPRRAPEKSPTDSA